MALPQVTGTFMVGSDYDVRFAPSGIAVGSFRAVASQSKKLDNGEWETTAEIWVTVTVFGQLAEAGANMGIEKGVQVDVLGRISNEEWTTKEGEKRVTQKLIADALGVRPRKNASSGQGSSQQGGGQSAGRLGDANPWGATDGEEPPF